MNKHENKEIWDVLEKHAPNLSDQIGWGSMQSLCEELYELISKDMKTHNEMPEDTVRQVNKVFHDGTMVREYRKPYMMPEDTVEEIKYKAKQMIDVNSIIPEISIDEAIEYLYTTAYNKGVEVGREEERGRHVRCNICIHEWVACPGIMCTSDLHTTHCKKCGKHGMTNLTPLLDDKI